MVGCRPLGVVAGCGWRVSGIIGTLLWPLCVVWGVGVRGWHAVGVLRPRARSWGWWFRFGVVV